jgi:hypothetical protein
MNFRGHVGGLLAGSLILLFAAARGQSWLPEPNVIRRSVSGQFCVFNPPGSPSFYPRPEPGTNAEILRLQPALLAVSADHFKTVLWPQLGLKPDAPWQGKIYLAIHPALSLDDGVTITSGVWVNRRVYRVELPDLVTRTRYARALTAVLLLEIANRGAAVDGRSAEIPGWLADGLAQQMLALNDPKLALSTPVPNAPAQNRDNRPVMARLNLQQRGFDPLAGARRGLQNSPALTFGQLSWPVEEQVARTDGGIYFASAQLFVSELLALPNGPARLQAMLRQLPACLNWQTAFFKAFHEDFPDALAVEKWWALRAIAFAARDPGPGWTARVSGERLAGLLSVPVQLRTNAASLPAYAEISLQAAIRSLEAEPQAAVLRTKIRDLEFAQLHVAPAYAALTDGYRAALADFLDEPRRSFPLSLIHRKAGVKETLKKLDALDTRRREMDEKLKPNPTPEKTVRSAA